MPVSRKRFGQHFLHDPAVIERIVGAVRAQSADTLVEIGPGHGALSRHLAGHVTRLYLIEIDRDLVAELGALYENNTTVEVLCGDALSVDFSRFGDHIRVIGNLPYNISTPLLFRLATFRRSITDALFMLQKEVVQRITAGPGSQHYGRLSVMLQSYWQAEALFDVGPGAFSPPPRVHSSVVRLSQLERDYAIPDRELFNNIVTSAFGQRRKTLRNSLRRIVPEAVLHEAGIDPGARAETLDIQQFVQLSVKARQLS